MKLYLLTSKVFVDYDDTYAILVRARSETAARDLASKSALQDRRRTVGEHLDFLDPIRSTCEVVTPEGKAEVILQSDRNG